MKKFLKWFTILAAAGTAVGSLIVWFKKTKDSADTTGDAEFTEDDDYDLDADLKPASEREYVSLNKGSEESTGSEETGSASPDSESE